MLSSLVMCLSALVLHVILFELTTPVHCTEYNKTCYTVTNRKVCFFRSQNETKWGPWHEASAICRRKNSSLPFIPDKAIQGVFEEYMRSLGRVYADDMWMAGKETRNEGWMWINGLPFDEPRYFTENHLEFNSVHLQAVLADGLIYKKEFPGNRSHFVCQFTGEECRWKNATSLKKGCVILSRAALNFYDARNHCLEQGGDLAVIDGQDDVNKFQQVFSKNRRTGTIWIGLQRQWWTWDLADTAEAKYSNWARENGYKPARACMAYNEDEFKWKQENCTYYLRFICQTGPDNIEAVGKPRSITVSVAETTTHTGIIDLSLFEDQKPHSFIFLAVGVSCLALTILVVIIVAAVAAKKRKTRLRQTQAAVPENPKSSYQHLELMLNGQYIPRSGSQQYTGLHTSTNNPPPLPPPARPVNHSPESVYDDIVETRVPSYLEIA